LRNSERGASMVEFVLLAPVILIMLAVAFDGFSLVYGFLRSSHATSQVSRELATGMARVFNETDDCSLMINSTCQLIDTFNLPAYAAAGMSYNVSVSSVGVGLPIVTVNSTREVKCMFCTIAVNFSEVNMTQLTSLEIPAGACSDASVAC